VTELTAPKRPSERIHRAGHGHNRGRPKKDPISHVEYVPPCYTDEDVAKHVAEEAERKKRAAALAGAIPVATNPESPKDDLAPRGY